MAADKFLKKETIHIWKISIPDPQSQSRLLSLLQQQEKEIFFNRVNKEDARRDAIFRGATRDILGAYCNIKPQNIDFAYGEHGKPSILKPKGISPFLKFNLSHSYTQALLAVAWDMETGVDLERIEPAKRIGTIGEYFFNSEERDHINANRDQSASLDRFYTIWTCKEAAAKAIGQSLPAGMIELKTPAIRSLEKGCLIHPFQHGFFYILTFQAFLGYKSAVCILDSKPDTAIYSYPQDLRLY